MPEEYEIQTEQENINIAPVALPEVKKVKDNGLSDMFTTPKADDNDMATDHLTSVSDEDVFGGDPDMSDLTDVTEEEMMGGDVDMSDLTQVSNADIIGRPMKKNRKIKRTIKRYNPQTLGGMNV